VIPSEDPKRVAVKLWDLS